MDLLHIARKLWRYKLVTLPIIAMVDRRLGLCPRREGAVV